MNGYHVIQWRSDGQGGWTDPRLVDHAEALEDAEAIYREILEDLNRHLPPEYLRVEIVQVIRHRDYRPDKQG